MDRGMELLNRRIKQSIESAREASAFIKKRAILEEEYAHGLLKMSRSATESYSGNENRAGTYAQAWRDTLKLHEMLSENRFRFCSKLTAISDDLAVLVRDAERARRQHREMGSRLEKNLLDAEASVERARSRFDTAAEDVERVVIAKNGGDANDVGRRMLGKSFSKGNIFKSKNPQQLIRHEDEFRSRKQSTHDALRKEANAAQEVREEYFSQHLPHVLRNLRETLNELDAGLQFQLLRYAFLCESNALGDGMIVHPVNENTSNRGLRAIAASVDNPADFREYLQSYDVAFNQEHHGPSRDNPYDEAALAMLMHAPPAARAAAEQQHSERAIFGIDLATQLARDGVEVPPILEICADAIERVGMQNVGIYRLSGTTSRVQKLKSKFDADWSAVDVLSDEESSDINIVAGCLKLWFRELPEPLLTYSLYPAFIEAAKIENDYLRQIRLHEQVNELPDANYATLRFLMAHLDRIRNYEWVNQMSAHNLAIVFGPTLLSPPPDIVANDVNANMSGGPVRLQDMAHQCMAIETILLKYRDIFVEGEE
ncbi:Rho GTPase-activating protein [Malassezia cuniculi]|uniref:Rho GTPase-activating protein n=1 Tax=Malassezia cuniculi TaxID=948313 RepID=A0AAF0JBP0_9BASI|nr:Rho GTPase-activating protein [Malassezia cuniculi]